eukprot:3180008-Amphidinium_carterae.1
MSSPNTAFKDLWDTSRKNGLWSQMHLNGRKSLRMEQNQQKLRNYLLCCHRSRQCTVQQKERLDQKSEKVVASVRNKAHGNKESTPKPPAATRCPEAAQ